MQALRIAGLVVVALWMAWISWRVEQIHRIATQTCGIAYADIEGWNVKNGHALQTTLAVVRGLTSPEGLSASESLLYG